MYFVIKKIVSFLLPLVMQLDVVGVEHIPENGPCILTPNHLSAFDTPTLLVAFPRKIWALAAEKHRGHFFYGPLLEVMDAIWVRRGAIDRQAIREAMAVLDRGEVLGMAPEGTRARGEYALQEGKNGPAFLATRADVSILPVAITGTEKIKTSIPHLKRARVCVRFGEPFTLPDNGRVRGEKLDAFTDVIMQHIARLLPEEYRGVYADQV